jgi:hypothetical protein
LKHRIAIVRDAAMRGGSDSIAKPEEFIETDP